MKKRMRPHALPQLAQLRRSATACRRRRPGPGETPLQPAARAFVSDAQRPVHQRALGRLRFMLRRLEDALPHVLIETGHAHHDRGAHLFQVLGTVKRLSA